MDKILKYLKTAKNLEEISNRLKISKEEVGLALIALKAQGHSIDFYVADGVEYAIHNPMPPAECIEWRLNETTGKPEKLFLISDTHFGSNWDNPDVVEDIYNDAINKGITTILHCGDITEGYYTNRGNHVHEIKAVGATDQAEYVIENYPKANGIKTYFLQGNHDFTHIRNGGADVGKMISNERKDLINLGFDLAEIKIGKTKIRLFHPTGGRSYAESYKAQKYIDAIPGGEKPHIYAQGHYHSAFFMHYRNVYAYSVPGLQAPTPFAVAKGMAGMMGYWELEFENDKDGNIVHMNNTLKQYHHKPGHKVLRKNKTK